MKWSFISSGSGDSSRTVLIFVTDPGEACPDVKVPKWPFGTLFNRV